MTPILLYGPTASGKSALAMALAQRLGGVIVNADSQQVYAGWRVLSARPSVADEAAVPHRLYGHAAIGADYSVGRWLDDVRRVLVEGRTAIVTGGTGLYFTALTQGLAPIPAIPPEVRADAEATLARLGLDAFAQNLAARDPATARTLDPANPVRWLRAWQVLDATGHGLAHWHAHAASPLVPLTQARAFVLTPPKDRLHARCDARFDAMLRDGALDEVRAAMATGLPCSHPSMRALGARELAAHLMGETTLDDAVARAKTLTRRYAKRQLTWARGRMAGWTALADPATALDTLLATLTDPPRTAKSTP